MGPFNYNYTTEVQKRVDPGKIVGGLKTILSFKGARELFRAVKLPGRVPKLRIKCHELANCLHAMDIFDSKLNNSDILTC